jgi:uncharacterized protein
VKIEFDPAKSTRNAESAGCPSNSSPIWMDAAHTIEDQRQSYGETRYLAYAPRHGWLHVVCFCIRDNAFRIISFRKANSREDRFYAEEKAGPDR